MNDRLRQILNLVLAVAQFAAPGFSAVTGIGGPIGRRAIDGGFLPPEQPAGWAFSIWFPIFALGLAYAVHQALPSARENPVYRRIGAATAAMFAAGTAWMLWTQIFGSSVVLLPLIFGMYAATMIASARLSGFALEGRLPRLLPVLLGLQGGWLTAAIMLNTTSVVRGSMAEPFGVPMAVYALATLLPATVLAMATILARRANGWFVFAFGWALVAIAFTNIVTQPNWPIAAATLAALGAIVLGHQNFIRTLKIKEI
ncbi:MAG: hypothetical protein ING44_02765 [Telmatospirillum sp.]|nr:hypothetical protein [Telmatospirillum sp.]